MGAREHVADMTKQMFRGALVTAILFSACAPAGNTPGGSGGATVPGSGGASPGSGGAAPSSGGAPGSGGANSSGGASSQTGGAPGTGGKSTGSGGMSGSGGATPGTGGNASGGRGSGGMTGTAGGGMAGRPGTGGGIGTGSGGTGSGSGGGGASGTCQKGQTKPAEVVIMGESFYAIAPQYIVNRIQDDARKAGSLGASDKYRNVSVSGQNMNYIATTEWTAATQGGAVVKYVIMDGGGIDCLGGGCSTCASTFKTLLGKMATAGVQEVIYTRYPEPGNPPGSNTSLKSCLDSTMPMMQTVCEGTTSPKCHWVDLRPVWVNGDTDDGLHPTQSGGNHVGDLIWSEMVKLCIAQ
jgi:hypothetical protein